MKKKILKLCYVCGRCGCLHDCWGSECDSCRSDNELRPEMTEVEVSVSPPPKAKPNAKPRQNPNPNPNLNQTRRNPLKPSDPSKIPTPG